MGATQQAFQHFVETGRFDYNPKKDTHMDIREIARIAEHTHLTPTTVSELVWKGWEYVEQDGHEPVWVRTKDKLKSVPTN